MPNLYPVEHVELTNGTLLLQGGEPFAALTTSAVWEPLLRREIAERLGLRVNFRPFRTWGSLFVGPSSFRWSGENGAHIAYVESWWRIAPVESAISNPPLTTEGGRSGL